ncbi:DUF6455 family protein [Tropicimonas sp. IMCC34043]|uniref:DUF6455 family protein n=1 Tax=Tropicimonas sp. IMCC34043 TaxID=2248760 RepID=UPI000E256295|nr:DUF6455 family protein [Tropicimonas sp. IMCC34043]
MKPLGPTREHYWLALGMAKAAGVDLQGAIDDGRFSQEKWARTVESCRGCEWGADCKGWLQEHPDVERAPETCVNAQLFALLKSAQQEPEDPQEAGAV